MPVRWTFAAVNVLCLTAILDPGPAAMRVQAAESNVETESGHAEIPLTDYDRDHWAFRSIERPPLPDVAHLPWCRTAIDRFILAKLEARDLRPMAEADRLTLLRRVTYDLTGLPPTAAEIEQFLEDDSPAAYERLVDRLLASPAYGERQALYWLDLARFAETDGFEHDHLRPEAWRYRDWDIEAFNANLPYDRFIAAQLAADELEPEDPQAQLATGFLLAAPDMPDINLAQERRHNFLNSMTANVGEVLLGLQYGCAQCHDHKTDPLSQYDFYRLRACFETLDLFQDQPLVLVDPQTAAPDVVKVRITRTSAKSKGESHLWVRGDFRRPGPVVAPGVPRAAVADDQLAFLRQPEGPRRAQLAEWIIASDNPLTARVYVNRLWQNHFGIGLVESSSDFGLMGIPPTHPELLDWLADEFVQSGWDIKSMHRLMVTSSVYRTRSRPSEASDGAAAADPVWQRLVESDPQNEWLGRMRRRRLEGEAIRDALLLATGRLNRQATGPGVRPPLPAEVVKTLLKNQWVVTPDISQHNRRSIYLFVRRNLKDPFFDVFDRPDQNLSCSRRQQTTIAPQALAMLNSEFAVQTARALGRDLQREAHPAIPDRVRDLYRRLFSREPTPVELQEAQQLLGSTSTDDWSDLVLALINANEFLYID